MRQNNRRVVLGLVGQPLAGKDMVAKHLVEKHQFTHVSTSDMVREYMKKNDLGEPARTRMKVVANDIRKKNGPGALVDQATALHTETERLVLSGLRSLGEMDSLVANGGVLLAIKAPVELRYQRSVERGRVGDGTTLEQFILQENAESRSLDPASQNVATLIEAAHYVIDNEASMEDLTNKINQLVNRLSE